MPDLELPDHQGIRRRLTELADGDPLVVVFYRGWWCPKEQAFFRRLAGWQSEVEVSYTRIVSISVDTPPELAAFRAGLDARWTFLSDTDREWLDRLGLKETTDTVHIARPAASRTRGQSGLVGALTMRRRDPGRLREDPFARLGHPLVARVGAGLLGTAPPPPGPVIQRYVGLP